MSAVKKLVAIILGGYLLIGAIFAFTTMPQQLWSCPAPDAPHGTEVHSKPLTDECTPTVSAGEQAEWFAFATPSWLPLLVAKGLDNRAES